MKKKNLLFILITLTISCNNINTPIKYVNTFIGTGGHGHTYPGVSLPFGMMQLSPDTRLEGWDGCGGYHYTDSIIYGFSHTHLSGTGISDYGDVLLMPTSGEVNLSNGVIESKNSNKKINELGYSSKFSHNNEKSEPGYYQVFLEDYDINVELTTSLRSGIHKYSYSKKDNANLILDLKHRDKLLKHNINIIDSMTISGFRYSDEWAREQRVYFLIKLSHPFINHTLNDEKNILGLTFGKLKKPLVTKVSISAVDSLGAIENFNEIVNLDFNQTKKNAQEIWSNQLNKIQIKTKSKEKKEIFYTALYHSFLAPNTYNDINGNYNGMDLKKHNSTDNHYTVFSLWDTFRASHPLFTILETKKTNEFIRTLLRQFQDGGKLPIWELAGNYTDCMIGYHAIPVIVDAYIKGIRDYDTDMALNAMVLSAESNTHGLKAYKKNGFIRASDEPESVSKNLEYAYDDWCIAVMADSLGKKEIAKRFYKRAQYYKNLYDPETGFFRGKNSYSWFGPFKPEEVNFNYTEANAWQYSLFVPQDISGHIKLKGGELSYEKHLDAMFESSSVTSGRHQPDVTGLIGQYAHGNEPSHHMAYLYNFIGKPSKTQKYTAQIMNEQYSNLPDGLSGNEDCGQMSAWYVLSSLGFYPVTPGLDYYTIGTPLFDEATINLENGNTFKIRTKNLNSGNIYIQSATLNGKEFNNSFLKHSTITNGGEILFNMGKNPSNWGEENRPYSIINSNKIVAVPFFISKSQTFVKDHYIELGTVDSSQIFFSIKGGDFEKYLSPIVISNNTEITIYAKKGKIESKRVTAKYFKIDNSKSIQISSKYANQYAAAGDKTLIDQLRGGVNYRTGNWQGYRENLEVVIDLNKIQKIKSISLGCHQDIRSWIFYPKNVEYWSSLDGENYDYLGKISTETPENSEGSFHKDIQLKINGIKTRYVKIKAKNYGICPQWHLGAGGKTWIFVDEIIIK
jgi:predicted alpha-1,2-mannosidase